MVIAAETARDLNDPFERALTRALVDLPQPFRQALESVAIVVEDEPTPDQLAAVRAHGLYGLYQGVPRTSYGAEHAAVASKITLFRGPLSRANPDPDALEVAVGATLRHEIGHHLGLSDARLRELERRWSR